MQTMLSPQFYRLGNKLNKAFVKIRRNTGLYILIAPVVLYYIIFHYLPMYGIQIAFKSFSPNLGIFGSPWSGFVNFQRFFNGYYFWRILRNTIGLSLYNILVSIPAPIILALMFNEIEGKKLRGFFQTVSYAPFFLSTVVVATIIIFFLSPSNGIFNLIIERLGGEPVNFLAEPELFWHIYVWSGVWQGVGWGTIIYTATISGIPVEQYESATIDGASRFQKIVHITIPGILPIIVVISILSIGNIMNVGFEKILLLQNPLNLERSDVIATYVYRYGLVGLQYSFGAAVGLFNNIVNFIILILANTFAKKIGEIGLW